VSQSLHRQLHNRQLHNGIDNVAVVVAEGADGLAAADAGLAHHDVDLLLLQARLHCGVFIVVITTGGGGGVRGSGAGHSAGGSLLRIRAGILKLRLKMTNVLVPGKRYTSGLGC